MPTGARLGALTWPEAAGHAGAILAVPLGATEQHGPHLPLSTDTDIAVALCERLAAIRDDVLVAPAVAYGASGEHAGFAGTLSIGQDATELLVVELGRSAAQSFAHLLLVCAHGGNVEPVTRATRRLRAEGQDVHAFLPQWGGDAHAGRTETSLQLALGSDGTHPERAEPGNTGALRLLWPQLRAAGVRAVSDNGVLGDPTGASAAEGADLLAALSADLAEQVAAWLTVPADHRTGS
jgi:mycofactocin precursor peptide peptidase